MDEKTREHLVMMTKVNDVGSDRWAVAVALLQVEGSIRMLEKGNLEQQEGEKQAQDCGICYLGGKDPSETPWYHPACPIHGKKPEGGSVDGLRTTKPSSVAIPGLARMHCPSCGASLEVTLMLLTPAVKTGDSGK
mgnify:CR=1 FL=1